MSSNEQQPQQPIMNEFEKTILDLFKRLSVCMAIMGRRDTGKTDISLKITEILNKYQVISNFATNIKIYESPFQIQHITNLEDLEFWSQTTQGRKLFILDEAGKTLRRRSPMSSLNIRILDDLQILRKYKLSLIMITPHEKYIDSAVLGSDVLDAIIIKPNYKNQKIALYRELLEDQEIWFHGIEPTTIKFNTWDIAPFKKSKDVVEKINDEDYRTLWTWANGGRWKDLFENPNECNRFVRKQVKRLLEKTFTGLPT